MTPFITLYQSQKGFTNSHGLLENIHILRQTLCHAKENERTLSAIEFDGRAAFDSVDHAHLKNIIDNSELPQKLKQSIILAYMMNVTSRSSTKMFPLPLFPSNAEYYNDAHAPLHCSTCVITYFEKSMESTKTGHIPWGTAL